MFYSQLLLSKTGALGVVWMAAHCHKRLRKCQIQQTDISSSVDKILDDGVQAVTHRILAFLLLGVVRIYSKQVEYLFNDCHEILNRLCSVKTRKRKHKVIGVSRKHYHSISLPQRFELDTFDLDRLEDQEAGGNVMSHEKDKLADWCRKDASTSGLHYKENARISGAYLKPYTPPRDVFGYHHMDQNLFMGQASNTQISLIGVEVLRGKCFSLEDHIDPILLDEAEEEQMHKKQSEEDPKTNFQGPTNEMESDTDVGPFDHRSHLLSSLEILRGSVFALEDRLEPMVLDEAEMEQLDGRPSKHNTNVNLQEPIRDMEFDFINHQSPKGIESVASLRVLHGSGISLEQLPNFKMLNEAEKGQGHEKQPDKEHRVEEEHVEHLSTRFNFQEGERHDFTTTVDKAKPVDEGVKVPEVITPHNIICLRPVEVGVSIVNPDSKLPAAGVGTSEVATVQTPGRKECVKILKKRKTLLDSTTVVVPNKVFKNWIDDPTDLKRKRREVPHTLLGAWRASKHAHVTQSFFEPSIPCISVDFECQKSCAPALKSVELSSKQDGENSPVTYGAQEQIPAVRSPVREKSPRQTVGFQSPVIEEYPNQTPIAPGTPPVAHFDQLRSHEVRAVADSDILEPTTSYESVEKGPLSRQPLGMDILFEEETSPFEGESLKNDGYSARTRMAGSYLSRMFLDKKIRKEEEVLNLSHLLAGKTKKEGARFFYETLVLKTRDCIDVQQGAAYHDILLRETPQLRQVSEL